MRRLPRGGVSRRFDAELLAALDMAYGLRPPAHTWETLPETFRATLELPARIDLAPALLFGARRLLVQLCGWLAARRAGTTAITLHWMHDVMRPKDAGTSGALTVRTAEPMRDVEHLCRLLAEHLARVTLAAPVGDLALTADEVHALHEHSADLIPQASAPREALRLVLERVAARLGPDRVLQPVMREGHRIEWTARWTAWPATPAPAGVRIATDPQPTWLLPKPLRLAVRDDRPLYQGPLQLLVGPQRIETGWWHAAAAAEGDTGGAGAGSGASGVAATHKALRDYWVAANEHAGVLWVYQERFGGDRGGWWLHGIFA
ncbi:DNA polymerase Y family protein [uncultured Xylophilus sp.]|uniref:DNA polymerase Y family protein n=1 Tax=uncultured Xylophilus sp. TaxID=296832 RepID=UPI003451315D